MACPSTGLHPLDVAALAGVFDRLLEAGATIIVIDHDLDPPSKPGCDYREGQAARRRTSQTVAAMSRTDSASSQPPSIHWNGQNRLPG